MAKKRPSRTKSGFENNIGDYYAKVTVPHDLLDAKKREQCGLPSDPKLRGPYIIELNIQHVGSLPGAASDFVKRFDIVINDTPPEDAGKKPEPGDTSTPKKRTPVRISKSYYRSCLNVKEWQKLLAEDARNPPDHRSIYKLWPDFPIKAQIDHSITTVKADAAHRAFDAGGDGIVWAVVDSGIFADHPHFGVKDAPDHLLTSSEVNTLHRCFAYVAKDDENDPDSDLGPLPSPDLDPTLPTEERDKLIARHRELALQDKLGHGTHVSGIIAGRLPPDAKPIIFERELKPDAEGKKVDQGYKRREISPRSQLTGVAPQCKLISLRVLNDDEEGRVSSVIRALDYVREHLNDNPKLMRVHGVNLSVGYPFDAEMFACGQSPLCVEVDRLVQSGVVVVAAAGNTGYGSVASSQGGANVGMSNTINDPGNAALAITVGSTHRDSPHTYGVSFFSSKGPTGDGRLKPDLVAPGERITSCAAGIKLSIAKESISNAGANVGDSTLCYIDDSGTSMAAPHVSGAIAAFLSIRKEFIGKPHEVKRIFLESATPLGRERYFEGHGLVDLMRAIQSV